MVDFCYTYQGYSNDIGTVIRSPYWQWNNPKGLFCPAFILAKYNTWVMKTYVTKTSTHCVFVMNCPLFNICNECNVIRSWANWSHFAKTPPISSQPINIWIIDCSATNTLKSETWSSIHRECWYSQSSYRFNKSKFWLTTLDFWYGNICRALL